MWGKFSERVSPWIKRFWLPLAVVGLFALAFFIALSFLRPGVEVGSDAVQEVSETIGECIEASFGIGECD